MDGNSQATKEERIRILKELVPEVFDEGKIYREKFKVMLGEEIDFANERYVLNWEGKSDGFRVMQQLPYITLLSCREEFVDFDNTQNIFIEGENIEVLKVLQKSYFGKIKMIYIVSLYNTCKDSFIYSDRFLGSKEEYLGRADDLVDSGQLAADSSNHSFYNINDTELVLMLESVLQANIDDVIAIRPQKVIVLDTLFKDNDQFIINTIPQMRDVGVEYKTI